MNIKKLEKQIESVMKVKLPQEFIAHIIIKSPYDDITIIFSCFVKSDKPAIFLSSTEFPKEVWPFQAHKAFTTKNFIDESMVIINSEIERSPIRIPQGYETKKFFSIIDAKSKKVLHVFPVE